jgi:hypothetical protein
MEEALDERGRKEKVRSRVEGGGWGFSVNSTMTRRCYLRHGDEWEASYSQRLEVQFFGKEAIEEKLKLLTVIDKEFRLWPRGHVFKWVRWLRSGVIGIIPSSSWVWLLLIISRSTDSCTPCVASNRRFSAEAKTWCFLRPCGPSKCKFDLDSWCGLSRTGAFCPTRSTIASSRNAVLCTIWSPGVKQRTGSDESTWSLEDGWVEPKRTVRRYGTFDSMSTLGWLSWMPRALWWFRGYISMPRMSPPAPMSVVGG